MGIIGSAIGAGLGQGMALFGAQLAQNEARWESEREKMAERRREQQAKLDLDREKLAAEAAKPLSVDQVSAKTLAEELSKVQEPDQANYTKDMMGPLAEGEDESARPQVEDRGGYAKAREATLDRKIGIINRVKDPSAMKSLREADLQSAINDWVKEAAAEPDPKKREAKLELLNQLTIAAEGKHMYGQGGEGQVMNVATGKTRATPVSEANVRQSEAAATASRGSATASYARAEESRADARLSDRTPARGGGKDDDGLLATLDIAREVEVNEKALARRLGTDVKDMNAALTRLQTRAESDPKAKEKLDSLAPLIQSLEEAEQRLRERNTKKSQRGADEKKADSGKKTASPADAAPEAPRDPARRRTGQVYQTPRGLMIWRGTGWEAARGSAN